MWPQEYSLIFDVAVTALLVVAIFYAAVLNHKLAMFGDAKGEMERLVRDLAETTRQAKTELGGLEQSTSATVDMLQRHADGSHRLADNIAFLVKRGEEITGRLESAISAAEGLATAAEAVSRRPDEPPRMAAAGNEAIVKPRRKPASKISEFLARSEKRTPAAEAKRSMSPDESELVKAFQAFR